MTMPSPRKTLPLLAAVLACAAGLVIWKTERTEERREAREVPPPGVPPRRGEPRPGSPARWQPLVDDSLPREERLQLARDIRGDIPDGEVEFLFSALRHAPRPGGEEAWWVVMNEIMEQMRKHGAGSRDYAERLGALVADPGQPDVVRDYAIQHLAQWLAPVSPETSPGETDPATRREALEKIAGAVRDPSSAHTTIPGTGLMALVDASSRLEPALAAGLWVELEPFLAGIIQGTAGTSVATRVTAIQAAALRGETAHLPSIRGLAANEALNPSIRLSSIAALGIYADPADRDFLESVARSGGRFQYAARAALARGPLPGH